jgi:uncharacterized lipoprotein
MRRIVHFFLLAGCVFLTGCGASSIMQNRDKQYLSARSVPPLRIPPGVSAAPFQAQYPVPSRTYPLAEKEVSIVPPGLYN